MKQSKSFFRGYSLVLHSLLTYLIYAAAASTGLNIIVPIFAAENGLDQNAILSANTVGAFISCIAVVLGGKIIMKYGVRKITTISLIVGGLLGTVLMGYVHTVAGYAICTIFAQCAVHGYCYTATNTLITNWWPRKKGFVMGITTCGIMAASFTAITLMSKVGNAYGMKTMAWMLGGFMVLFGIISWFWIRNNPEECGLNPDNMPLSAEEVQAGLASKQDALEAAKRWPFKELVKNKAVWILGIVFGLFLLFTSGVASTTVAMCIENGYTPAQGLTVLSLTGVVSIVGSLVSGVLDQKFGPKITTVIYGIWVAISFATLLFIPGGVRAIVCIAMANFTMGATSNLAPSFVGSIFGRAAFAQVYRWMYALSFLVRSLCFLMLGTGVAILGSYTSVYIVFGVLSLVAVVLCFFVSDKKIQVPSTEKV